MSATVVLEDVSHTYLSQDGAPVNALGPVNLTVESGEFVCLVGPSGCGKSTLLKTMAGFVTPTSGTLTLGGAPITGPGPERGVVFQQPNLLPWLDVRSNVELGPRFSGLDKTTRGEIVDRYLRLVRIEQFADHRPYELSGGMQQRCQLARVLANDPEMVLMDEPFGALDALTRERMQDELLNLWKQSRSTIFLITHSIDEAILLGTRVLVMSARPGRIVVDEPLRLAEQTGVEGNALRTTPQFADMRAKISEAVYAAQ